MNKEQIASWIQAQLDDLYDLQENSQSAEEHEVRDSHITNLEYIIVMLEEKEKK